VAGVLLLATAKCEGEITQEQKAKLQQIFSETFHLSEEESSELLTSTTFLLRNEDYIDEQVDKILEHTREKLDDAHAKSLLSLMRDIASMNTTMNEPQRRLIERTEECLVTQKHNQGPWH
ncbi:MAG: TerB family tellurite resistance protein, partial [Bacteroidota bacterium]